MSPIRFLAAGLVAVAISAPAMAQTCVQPAEKAAFDVRALQSQLMVAALSCQQEEQYNTFVRQYNAELGTAYKGINAHYRRTAGARGQSSLDGYITSLANAQSQDGIRQGSNFCRNVLPLFTAALAAPKSEQGLALVAVQNNLSNPHGRSECGGAATPAARTAPEPSARRGTAVRRVSAQAR
jgi:opacity protein-like surface antigen